VPYTQKVDDCYLRYFLSCNLYSTYQEVSDVKVDANGMENNSSAPFTLVELLSVLKGENISGYFYSKMSNINGFNCVFSKYAFDDTNA